MVSKSRKRIYRKRKTVKKLATKKYVKKLLSKNVETKYYDYTSSDLTIDALGTIVSLTSISQGQTDITRIGDKVTIRSVKFRLNFALADIYNSLRVIVFQWYPNSAMLFPLVGNILSATMGTSDSYMSHYTHDYQNQFNILYDKILYVDSFMRHLVTISKRVRMKYVKKTLNFVAATSEASNHIYMLLLSDSTASTHPEVSLYARVYYDDA